MNSPVLIKAGIFVLAALVAGILLRPRLRLDGVTEVPRDLYAYALIATAALFVITNSMVVVVLLLVMTAFLARHDPARAAGLFIGLLILIPENYEWRVPFPGINYFMDLDQARVLALGLLIPAAFVIRRRDLKGNRRKLSTTDILVVIYFVYTLLLDFRSTETVTNSMRIAVYNSLSLPLIYYVLTRAPTTWQGISKLIQIVFYATMLLVSIGFIGAIQNWNHYADVVGTRYSMRAGQARTTATLGTTDIGAWMTFAGVMLYMLRDWITPKMPAVLGWGAAAFVVLVSSQSRGGMLVAIFCALAVLWFKVRSVGLRWTLAVGGTVGAFLFYQGLKATGFTTIDEYGTFSYRQELLDAAWIHVLQFPLFGSADYQDSPIFAHLYQGQGIIDFVNGYIQIVLPYGLIGLGLFVSIIVTAWFALLRTLMDLRRANQDDHLRRKIGVVFGVMLPATALMIMTVSFVSYIFELLVVSIAYCQAFVRVAQSESARSTVPATAPTPIRDNGFGFAPDVVPTRVPHGVVQVEPQSAPDLETDWSSVLGIQKPSYEFDVLKPYKPRT